MNVLGIETSCDETSAAVVSNGKDILSNITVSSLNLHKKYNGIIPEIAFRRQLETITQVTEEAIRKSRIKIKALDLISVTANPGLLGSLLVGLTFAKAVSLSYNIRCIEVDHLYAHIYSALLGQKKPVFPFIALVISGGHTSLFKIDSFEKFNLIGSTLDDACGEAFDKVSKILGLGYPGGPIVERMARYGKPSIRFNCCDTNKKFDFSFSGIKTAVLYYVNNLRSKQSGNLSKTQIYDICASFQKSVAEALIKKSFLACSEKRSKLLIVAGGVAANTFLRESFLKYFLDKDIKVIFPSKTLCMDNAAMVAGIGYHLFKKAEVKTC